MSKEKKKNEGPVPPLRARAGFTFIEVLVVVGLFAIISVSLFSSFTMGMRVWRRASTPNFALRKSLIALERLSKELRCLYKDPSLADRSPAEFTGEKNNLSFRNLYQEDLWQTEYWCADCLSRRSVTVRQLVEGEPAGPARNISCDLQECAFSYARFDNETSGFIFQDTWNASMPGLPLAVKAALTLEDGTTLEKIITIPIAP